MNGSIGVVSDSGIKITCCVCESTFCIHCGFFKKANKKENKHKVPTSSKWKKSLSWKKVQFDCPNPQTLKPPSSYLITVDDVLQSSDGDLWCPTCEGVLSGQAVKPMKLICKNYTLDCEG